MSFFLSHLGWVSIWSAEVHCDHLFGLLRPTQQGALPLFERAPTASVVRANLVSWVILIFCVNQATQLLFSTEFCYWAILFLLLFISLINIWIGRLAVSPSNTLDQPGLDPGSKGLSGKNFTEETVKRAKKWRLKNRHDRDLQLFEGLLQGKGDQLTCNYSFIQQIFECILCARNYTVLYSCC